MGNASGGGRVGSPPTRRTNPDLEEESVMPVRPLVLAAILAAAPAWAQEGEVRPNDLGATGALLNAEGQQLGNVSAATSPEGGTLLTGNARGFPAGVLAVHLHETGLCEGPDFETAGGHLGEGAHGFLTVGGPHAGDLPNVFVQEDGMLVFDAYAPEVDETMLLDEDGTALIVHAGRDDYFTQPSGGSGARIACAVFEFDLRILGDETVDAEAPVESAE